MPTLLISEDAAVRGSDAVRAPYVADCAMEADCPAGPGLSSVANEPRVFETPTAASVFVKDLAAVADREAADAPLSAADVPFTSSNAPLVAVVAAAADTPLAAAVAAAADAPRAAAVAAGADAPLAAAVAAAASREARALTDI